MIKKQFGYEEYLNNINNIAWRRELTKLRITAHKLQIEVGRYSKIDKGQRICKYYDSKDLENEIHFLIHCK